jgi:hypothetical protein
MAMQAGPMFAVRMRVTTQSGSYSNYRVSNMGDAYAVFDFVLFLTPVFNYIIIVLFHCVIFTVNIHAISSVF